MFNTARNLTILYIIYLVLMPLPMNIEASADVAGTMPEIELRAEQKPQKDKISRVLGVTTVKGNCKQVWDIAKSIGASDREAEILSFIAEHESTCGVNKVSKVSYARGLFQWLPSSWNDHCRHLNRNDDTHQVKCSLKIVRRGFTAQCNNWYRWWQGTYDHRYGYCENKPYRP